VLSCWAAAAGLLTIFELPWLALLMSPLYFSLSLKKISFKDKNTLQYGLLAAGLFLGIIKEVYL